MTAKELLKSIKAHFDSPAPAAPAAPTVPTPVVYSLADGTQIAITQAGALPAPGDTVTIAGAPAPEGVLTLQDGTLITTDATGTITQYTPVAPAAAAAPPNPAANVPPLAAPAPVTQSAMTETNEAKFEEQIKPLTEAVAGYEAALKTQAAKFEAQEKIIEKHAETIKGLFDLVEKLVELPTADPKTLTGLKKEKFDRANEKEEKLNKIASAIKQMREGK